MIVARREKEVLAAWRGVQERFADGTPSPAPAESGV